jgi:hypothetical protein
MHKNIKFKLVENTNAKNGSSKFTLSYFSRKIDSIQASDEIISALKADSDIILEVNSEYHNLNENENTALATKLTGAYERMNVEYRKKKIVVDSRRSILSFAIKSEKVEGFQLFAYITDEIWCEQEFKKLIPDIVVKYYILKPDSEINLDAFIASDEQEKLDLCTMEIFDLKSLGSMGINTSMLKKEDISGMLGNNK